MCGDCKPFSEEVFQVASVVCRRFMRTLQFAFVSSDYNYGKWSSSKDILGFPKYPPFSFSSKNRKLWVSWLRLCGIWIRKVCWFSGYWKVMWLILYCSSPRSFDTESEESRWVVFQSTIAWNSWSESCLATVKTWIPICSSLELYPACQWHHLHFYILLIDMQHKVAHKPPDSSFLNSSQ